MIIHCDTTRFIGEVLERGEYSFLFQNLVVVDLGCNIGTFSLWIYPLAKKICAVDCDPEVLDLFKSTIKDNDLEKIEACQGLIGDGKGDSITLSRFLSEHRIDKVDVLKMDIEGDETGVVHAEDFPADKVSTIIGELHFSDERRDKFIERLHDLGYSYEEFLGDPSQAIHFRAKK